jgi:predicted DNA-binding transcriptional regulator AlpA
MPGHNTGKPTIIARLLTRQQAAAYCGVSVPTFDGICPIKPVALGTGKRLERFDRISLDRWINSLTPGQLPNSKDWLAELGNT